MRPSALPQPRAALGLSLSQSLAMAAAGEAGTPVPGVCAGEAGEANEPEAAAGANAPPESADADDVFEVEQILDEKTEEGNVLYKVRWKGYASEDDTWEPEVHLQDCKEVLLEFRNRIAEKMKPVKRDIQNEFSNECPKTVEAKNVRTGLQ